MRRRKILRLRDYDYARPGWYAVTIVTRLRRKLLGRIAGGRMDLTPAGEMVVRAWLEMPLRYSGIGIDEFIVMPDHVHGLVVIEPPGRAHARVPTPGSTAASGPAPALLTASAAAPVTAPHPTVRSLPDAVHRFKSFTTAEYRRGMQESGWPPIRGPLWQRSYWDDIVRTGDALDRIRRYIRMNPMR
jgi:REP element-mobilizing transposase RayT